MSTKSGTRLFIAALLITPHQSIIRKIKTVEYSYNGKLLSAKKRTSDAPKMSFKNTRLSERNKMQQEFLLTSCLLEDYIYMKSWKG